MNRANRTFRANNRHFDEYAYTLWATAHSYEALVSSYATLAGLLKLPEAGAQDQTAAVDAVKLAGLE